jgi:hypothetical protein
VTLVGIEDVIGTKHRDELFGDGERNRLERGARSAAIELGWRESAALDAIPRTQLVVGSPGPESLYNAVRRFEGNPEHRFQPAAPRAAFAQVGGGAGALKVRGRWARCATSTSNHKRCMAEVVYPWGWECRVGTAR